MRILMVAQAFYPNSGSHASRVTNFALELSRRGNQVCVVTCTWQGRPNYEMYERVIIHRAFVGPLHWCKQRLSRPSRVVTEGNSLVRRLAIPDPFVEWAPFAVVKAWTHVVRSFRPDVVLTSAVPYSSHLAGAMIAALAGAPLVLDYGDPWVFDPGHPRGWLRFTIEYQLESWVLRRAAKVFVTTDATRRVYAEKYHLDANKVVVIPMGYDPEFFHSVQSRPRVCCGATLHLGYAGTIRSESRDLTQLCRALAMVRASNFSLDILGKVDTENLRRLQRVAPPGKVNLLGWTDSQQVVARFLLESDVLILLGNNNPIQIPGKLFEYLGSGTPILYVRGNPAVANDECVEALERSGRFFWVVDNDAYSLAAWLETALRDPSRIRVLRQSPHPPLEEFTWSSRVERLMAELQPLTG